MANGGETSVDANAVKHSHMRQPRLELAGVHHVHNVLDGEAGLRDVGCQHHLRSSARRGITSGIGTIYYWMGLRSRSATPYPGK